MGKYEKILINSCRHLDEVMGMEMSLKKDIPFPLFRCKCGKCLKVTPWFFHRWQARLCYKIGFVRYKR